MSDTPDNSEPEDLIRYDILAQEALRGVVKKVIQEVTKTGLPGDHHFYITFDTNHPGVRLSSRMKEKYPDEMTIVVQHQFWDLESDNNGFSIGLSFDNIPESLLVPFSSIRGFFDPSVQFGLQFDADPEAGNEEGVETTKDTEPKKIETSRTKISALPAPDDKEEKSDKPGSTKKSKSENPKAKKTEETESVESADEENTSADVVSLDAFRKK